MKIGIKVSKKYKKISQSSSLFQWDVSWHLFFSGLQQNTSSPCPVLLQTTFPKLTLCKHILITNFQQAEPSALIFDARHFLFAALMIIKFCFLGRFGMPHSAVENGHSKMNFVQQQYEIYMYKEFKLKFKLMRLKTFKNELRFSAASQFKMLYSETKVSAHSSKTILRHCRVVLHGRQYATKTHWNMCFAF